MTEKHVSNNGEQDETPEEEISKGRHATYPKELQGNGCDDQRTWEKTE